MHSKIYKQSRCISSTILYIHVLEINWSADIPTTTVLQVHRNSPVLSYKPRLQREINMLILHQERCA